MNQKEIKELIELLVEKDIAEFEIERGDVKLHIKRGGEAHAPQVVQMAAPAPVAAVACTAGDQPGYGRRPSRQPLRIRRWPPMRPTCTIVKSPIVGTFYEAASPGSPPFVAVGDTVKEGQVLCIIEAMKLMNEIEADASGEIVKQFVQQRQPGGVWDAAVWDS